MSTRRIPGRALLSHAVSTATLLACLAGANPLGAQDTIEADGTAAYREHVGAVVDRFIEAFNRVDEAAMTAAFGPRWKVFEVYLGEERFAEAGWLDEPWRYHSIHVPPGWTGELRVLERMVSGAYATQRERLTWTADDGRSDSMVRMATYQVRGDRIHRLWLLADEPDASRMPAVAQPTYPANRGPTVWVDGWHWNTSTPDGTLWPFAEMLRRDGHDVRVWEAPFTRAALDTVDVLVIANAQPEPVDATGDTGPAPPSTAAFTSDEVAAVTGWVEDGGALLLIADHEPFAGAAADLAAAFGATFHDGAARDTLRAGGGGDMFRRSDGTLRSHPVTNGASPVERVDSVMTFLGQAFQADPAVEPILVLRESMMLFVNGPDAPQPRPVGGWFQAGARPFGAGRVALFGEAWMFRFLEEAPSRGPAAQNAQLILNLMRWLVPPDTSVQ